MMINYQNSKLSTSGVISRGLNKQKKILIKRRNFLLETISPLLQFGIVKFEKLPNFQGCWTIFIAFRASFHFINPRSETNFTAHPVRSLKFRKFLNFSRVIAKRTVSLFRNAVPRRFDFSEIDRSCFRGTARWRIGRDHI